MKHPVETTVFSEDTTKSCPFCAETILKDAIKCKHCGEFLIEESKQLTRSVNREKKKSPVLGIAIGVFLGLFLFFTIPTWLPVLGTGTLGLLGISIPLMLAAGIIYLLVLLYKKWDNKKLNALVYNDKLVIFIGVIGVAGLFFISWRLLF